MQKFPAVVLHRNKTGAVKRFHPWIFSGAVKKTEGALHSGQVVEVYSEDGTYLATGHYGKGSVAVRIFSFQKVTDLPQLWRTKLQSAYHLRKQIGLTDSAQTTTYRLVFGEGDGMPGLIIDWYNGTAVIQAHFAGMYNERQNICAALQELYGNTLKAVFDKSGETLHKVESLSETKTAEYLFGKPETDIVNENGLLFRVNWEQGQKTGFFIDQRDNRSLLASYSKDKKILNAFCYSGGFSVYGLKAGASSVHSVDSSAKAIDWTNENTTLNGSWGERHQSFAMDVFDFIKQSEEEYDIIILDPPAFAKSQSARHNAIQAYTRLNNIALKKIRKGGLLFTFSCSQVVTPDMFNGAITSAAIDSGRKVQVLHHLTQPADHPVSIYNPEGLYLKGLVLYVE